MTHTRRFAASLQSDSTLELLAYDGIGLAYDGSGVTAQKVADAIGTAGRFDQITLRVNSPGGDAFEGVAIYNLLKAQRKPVTVYVDGLAASAASIVAMAGRRIYIGTGAMMMIHNAWTVAIGDATEMRKTADLLDKVSGSIAEAYQARTGKSAAQIQELQNAETWMNAEEAIALGFADALQDQESEDAAAAQALARQFDLKHFTKAPAALAAETAPAEENNLSQYEARLRFLR